MKLFHTSKSPVYVLKILDSHYYFYCRNNAKLISPLIIIGISARTNMTKECTKCKFIIFFQYLPMELHCKSCFEFSNKLVLVNKFCLFFYQFNQGSYVTILNVSPKCGLKKVIFIGLSHAVVFVWQL